MRLNTLKPAKGSRPDAKRIGRGLGSGFGKTAGRGHKGQKSRAGGSIRPGFEGGQMPLQMRIPKFGFSSRVSRTIEQVTLSEINKVEGDEVDLVALKKASLIKHNTLRAKIILSGEIKKAVTVRGLGVTKGARQAIEAAGGKVEE